MYSVSVGAQGDQNPPSFEEVLSALADWLERSQTALAQQDRETALEVRSRIQRLQISLHRLLSINSALLALLAPPPQIDHDSDTMTQIIDGVAHTTKFKRADPNIPVQIRTIGSISTFPGGIPRPNDTPQTLTLKGELVGLLEEFYYNAHRVLKLIQKLPRCRNLKCKEISIVRNKLIEHADHGDVYSFGVTSQGPVVRPVVPSGRAWVDGGLIPNTNAFTLELLRTLHQ
jgi:hypothetical protein